MFRLTSSSTTATAFSLTTRRFALHASHASRLASTLVICEQKDGKLAASTLNAITAASKLGSPGSPITALVTGTAADAPVVAKQVASITGITRVLTAAGDQWRRPVAEELAPLVAAVVKAGAVTHVVAAHSAYGKNVVPRVAAMLDCGAVSDVVGVSGEDTFVRPIYAGNAISTVKSTDKVKLLTVRSTAFPPAAKGSAATAVVEEAPKVDTKGSQRATTRFEKEEVAKSDRPELGSAKVVVAGGRGMKNGESFKLLYDLADKMGGAVGASRAAVDAGFVPNDLQIGQTGKVVAPQLYIAVGISGAIQHLAGMKDSKVIVAVNKDPEAPIFQVADYGLVQDLFKAVPEITSKIKK